MNIWNYISTETSKLEELLDSKETTLDQVLDDESVISEMKNLNHKLLEFFNPERILEMLDYVVTIPPEGCSEIRGYKLPYVSSELFISEVSVIMNSFFPVDEPKDEFGDFQGANPGGSPIEKDENEEKSSANNANINSEKKIYGRNKT